jgi:hypothetical protein
MMKIDCSFSRKTLLILVLSVASDFAYAQHQDGSLVKMVDVLESTIITRLKAAGRTDNMVNKEAIPILIDGRMCTRIDVPDCKLSDVLEISYKPIFYKFKPDEEMQKLVALYGYNVAKYGVIVIKTKWKKE